MAYDRSLRGSSLLQGDNTIPGIELPPELDGLLPTIFKAVRDFGCDFPPTVVQMLTYDEISEVAAYGGFPVRFPHWKWGMEYEELQKGYVYGMHRIYEMVINTTPCYIYCLNSNTLVDNVTVVAHALGHADFFKNNVFFSPTTQNAMNDLANHGSRIRRYIDRWGKERVTEFIDHMIRIETLVDPAMAWKSRRFKDPTVRDKRNYHHPELLPIEEDHEYMEPYINTPEFRRRQEERARRKEVVEQLELFTSPTKDIMGFIKDNGPFKPWQQDIASMMYQEALYFAPQRVTKALNEGWASYIDYNLIARQGLCSLGQEGRDHGIIEYAKHKTGVLGGKYSRNPYKLGFCLFTDIEERWDKGQFGDEWEKCTDIDKRENWDKQLGLGREKVFEVRKHYNDVLALQEFFTQEFCDKYEFYEWQRFPNGEYQIISRDHKAIKKKLIDRYLNGGLPIIKLADPNYEGKGYMLLEHQWDGRPLYRPYVSAVLSSLCFLWQNNVYLVSRNSDDEEIVFASFNDNEDEVLVMSREDFETKSETKSQV